MTQYPEVSTGSVDFVARHHLWNEGQRAAAAELTARLAEWDLVRVVFGDPHGLARSKTFTPAAFATVLRNGMDASPGPFVFDTGHAVAVDIFADGGGIGVPELTGAGDFVVVPDPTTFRVLPTDEARVGWVIGDEYLRTGEPHPLSSRGVLRRQLDRLTSLGLEFVVGLEIEWYLTRILDGGRVGEVGGFGTQGDPPRVELVNGGYQFNSDQYTADLLPVLAPLARALTEVGLPLRTMEHESGPGQLEFTFDPLPGLAAADAVLLLKAVVRQVCGRLGYHASFMALPGLPGVDASGWHLHQSLFSSASGRNAFTAAAGGAPLSELGMSYLAGLLDHAAGATLLGVPTVTGYRRLSGGFALAPDRVGWSVENRGGFIRVLGAPGEESTHLENRVGEPAANPYLYLAAQLASGMDGVDRGLDPGERAADPHATSADPLPTDLGTALACLRADPLLPSVLGEPLLACLTRLKQSEISRYAEWLEKHGPVEPYTASGWEHREYFAVY